MDIIKKASKLFNKLIVVVVKEKYKDCLFSVENRLQFIRQSTVNFSNVETDYWPKPLHEYVAISHAVAIIRGIKSCFNLNNEINFNIFNETSNNELTQTIFMMPNPKNIYINCELVRNLCLLKKNLSSVVPKVVEQEIKKEVLKCL